MIEKYKGQILLRCDECDNYTTDMKYDDEFKELIASAKNEGWVILKQDNDEWEHICPECTPDTPQEVV